MYGNVECSDVESDGGDLGNETNIKHVYRDDTWKQEHITCDPKLQNFVGVPKPSIMWNQFLTIM